MFLTDSRSTCVRLCVILGLAVTLFVPNLDAAEKATPEESWSVMYMGGKRIGYSKVLVETVDHEGLPLIKTSVLVNMTIKRFNQTLVMKQYLDTEETADGQLRHFRSEMANPPAASTVTKGTVSGQELVLTSVVNGKEKITKKPWKAEVKSPAYQDRLLKENPLKPGESRSFECFFPEFTKVGTVNLKGVGQEEVTLLDGKKRSLLRVTSTQTLIPGVTIENYLDEQGETIKTTSAILGSSIETYHVSKEEALKSIEGGELDLGIDTLVKVNPILKSHETKKIVYKVTIAEQDPIKVIPEGDTQSLKKIDGETAELTVISLPLPPNAAVGNVGSEFLESSQYLQSTDDRVKKHASRAAGDAKDPSDIARRMEKYVNERLEMKNFSTAMASAGEVAEKMEGDCTEHAVLLAAMLRAKGIPSRVVVGLVYSDRLYAFGGHMWTEANLGGKWIPLDATLANGGIGAAHIRLADSSLSDNGPPAISGFASLMNVIGKLKLSVISAE